MHHILFVLELGVKSVLASENIVSCTHADDRKGTANTASQPAGQESAIHSWLLR